MSEGINKTDIDLSYLSEIASGSTEFMIEMINIFLEQTPIYFTQLNDAINSKDWKTTGDIAHKIKPTFAFMGLACAKDVMQEIERKARNLDSVDSIPETMKEINALCDSLYAKLESHKKALELKL